MGANLKITPPADETLNVAGFPADSKAVGAALDGKLGKEIKVMEKTITSNQWGELWLGTAEIPGIILDVYSPNYLLVRMNIYPTIQVYRVFGNITAGNLNLTASTEIPIKILYI